MIHGLCDGLNWSSKMYNNPNHVYRSEKKIFQSFTLMEHIHMYISQQKKNITPNTIRRFRKSSNHLLLCSWQLIT